MSNEFEHSYCVYKVWHLLCILYNYFRNVLILIVYMYGILWTLSKIVTMKKMNSDLAKTTTLEVMIDNVSGKEEKMLDVPMENGNHKDTSNCLPEHD